jgi:hypothetical protein
MVDEMHAVAEEELRLIRETIGICHGNKQPMGDI